MLKIWKFPHFPLSKKIVSAETRCGTTVFLKLCQLLFYEKKGLFAEQFTQGMEFRTERPTVYKTWGSTIVTRRWIITATTTAVGKIFNRWFGLIWHTLMHHFFHGFLYGFFATFFLFEGATCSFWNAVAFCYGLALPYRNL